MWKNFMKCFRNADVLMWAVGGGRNAFFWQSWETEWKRIFVKWNKKVVKISEYENIRHSFSQFALWENGGLKE